MKIPIFLFAIVAVTFATPETRNKISINNEDPQKIERLDTSESFNYGYNNPYYGNSGYNGYYNRYNGIYSGYNGYGNGYGYGRGYGYSTGYTGYYIPSIYGGLYGFNGYNNGYNGYNRNPLSYHSNSYSRHGGLNYGYFNGYNDLGYQGSYWR